ncbi:caspase family protein [Roseiconus lacunae]|uniref:Caspase family protein n=1 Tax=Roseiconus lacunae TaxID=2605694 RepID=A0ABT7PS59_9BACT|nr:caspase family protein [Roseiconus lacunae]MDM4019335.1 caspase family protein [Roseiconus lacunae]
MTLRTILIAAITLHAATSAPIFAQDAVRGQTRRQATTTGGYSKSWALIVGVNYAGEELDELRSLPANREAIPELKNAVNDAKELASVLQRLYGYHEEQMEVLTGDQAKKPAIEKAIGKLCDPEVVSEDDSILVFFSGHGVRLANGDSGVAILPYDVQLSNGNPISQFFRLHEDVFDRLNLSPAKHKLVILDHCYSGDIFNREFQARSESDDRSDPRLQLEKTFQAMASARATQVASDGKDGHSPFSAALLDGLRQLPAHKTDDRRIWAESLLAYIRPSFSDKEQRPDCRLLSGGDNVGEFCFYPVKPDPVDGDPFDQYRVPKSDHQLLKALVSTRQGDWWFNEIPWFIPSVRAKVLESWEQSQPKPRSSVATFIDPEVLRKAAFSLLGQKGVEEPKHLRKLLNTHRTRKFEETLQNIEQMLSKEQESLAAVDHHLLAIVQHAVGNDEAGESYKAALLKYKADFEQNTRPSDQVLIGLCSADYGEWLLEANQAKESASAFRNADETIRRFTGDDRQQAAAVFRIFILCREADAWLRINRWKDANDRLLEARDLATNYAAKDFLMAHVHRRRAWAEIIQWRINEAACSFMKSNEILAYQFRSHTANVDDEADSVEPLVRFQDAIPVGIDSAFYSSRNFTARVAYLHNLHGLAMASRFRGETQPAAERYRSLSAEVESTLSDLQEASSHENIESKDIVQEKLIGRSINTLERLGDCNLFGHPDARDLKEAYDDYRLARNKCYQITGSDRIRLQSSLLYKQALSLALPSQIQDTTLALELAQRADETYNAQETTATGLYWALGKLTTKTVSVLHEDATGSSRDSSAESATSVLREVISDCRDEVGQYPHRDQLELLLFATQVLIEHGDEKSRFQISEDADLLQSFCQMALAPHRSGKAREASESMPYLRPYFDTAMRAKMKTTTNHVKDMLQIQSQATTGRRYIKQTTSAPILATYILDGGCHLLIDLPRGGSKVISLAEMYDLDTIRGVNHMSERTSLPLPREAHDLLVEWKQRSSAAEHAGGTTANEIPVYCYWEDPLHEIFDEATAMLPKSRSAEGVYTVAKPVVVEARFPFALPDGFAILRNK